MNDEVKECIPAELKYLAKIIINSGYNFYIVGGFVRDIFLRSCDTYENDIDVCGDCIPEIFTELIANDKKIKLCKANFPLGTLKLIVDKLDIEYTCFRTESYRRDGYHTPTEISFTKDITQDANRRDFSINSMYLNPLTYEIIDIFNGQKDIEKRTIRTVRESTLVFSEDALRILRMCRFSAKFGFHIDKKTLAGAAECAHLLKNISKERIGSELDKIIWDTEHIEYGIHAIYETGINNYICKNIKKDTALLLVDAPFDRAVRWSVFLSDLSAEDAFMYLEHFALGKKISNAVFQLIKNKNIVNNKKDEIILSFAKLGESVTKRLIKLVNVYSAADSKFLNSIFSSMQKNNQFITYDMLSVNGSDITEILSVKGKSVGFYKEKAYEFAVLNPGMNTYNHIKNYLLKLK